MKAVWNDVLLAESDDTVVVEGSHYFPRESLRQEHFAESDHTTVCPWKGRASYLHVESGGMRNANAAWFYSEPKPEAAHIRDRVAFWKGVEVRR